MPARAPHHHHATTLVIFAGPTDLPDASSKSKLYHKNLHAFLELRVSPHGPASVTTIVVLTKLLKYLEKSIQARGATVLYRRNICYDMEAVRVALSVAERLAERLARVCRRTQ